MIPGECFVGQVKISYLDEDILINTLNIQLFGILEKLRDTYNWELRITPAIKEKCTSPSLFQYVNKLIKDGIVKPILENSKEVALIIEELSVFMTKGEEIELFAIGEYRGFNIITDDRENTNAYFKNRPRKNFWVYDLYHILYLAHKAKIFEMKKIDFELRRMHEKGFKIIDRRIINSGFKIFCDAFDANIDKHFDPFDIAILKSRVFLQDK